MKVKLLHSIYLDYETGIWDSINPKCDNPEYKLKQDYTMLRKGSIGIVDYSRGGLSAITGFEPPNVLVIFKSGEFIEYHTLEQLYKSKWFKVIIRQIRSKYGRY